MRTHSLSLKAKRWLLFSDGELEALQEGIEAYDMETGVLSREPHGLHAELHEDIEEALAP